MKKIPQGVVFPCPGAIRMYMITIFKALLLSNRLVNQSQISWEPHWEGKKKVYINGPGHMTKMAAMSIYGIKLKQSTPTELIVLMKFGMKHLVLKLYKVYVNDDPTSS